MSGVARQFPHVWQQRESASLGMWIFIATEILFFGALFFVYAHMRLAHADDFAQASRHTDVLLGTLNTAILLTSSLTMVLAVESSSLKGAPRTRLWIALTVLLGLSFMGFKSLEYYQDYREHLVPWLDFRFDAAHAAGAALFFSLYFVTTGLHALHLTIGIAILCVLSRQLRTHSRPENLHGRVEVVGLYWHFVDVVWIFLYPLLYLVARA